ncbi:hypothetical protein OCH239_13080 [Roseivivax halodurans JCM 10272]|uniref:Uncharacterized protein n=1 Tax=Roseivivax halodurans JCM 10272 TaxID=1449350 RepID=X7ED82_9RHOB|nr:hypothetical protein [Roseivivax halodurans]ETX13161.1 hypothetical protein OCH239_13080 [Roseivivax halodurans JCM 10272]
MSRSQIASELQTKKRERARGLLIETLVGLGVLVWVIAKFATVI